MREEEFYKKWPNAKVIGRSMYAMFDRLYSEDPNFEENAKLGRYMPRINGIRTDYRGKDLKKHIINKLIGFGVTLLFFYIFILLILNGIKFN